MPTDLDIVREELRGLLARHVASPLYNIQEAERQLELASLLRQKLPGSPTANVVYQGANYQHAPNLRTSRVHVESKLLPNDNQRFDVAVLNDTQATLTCARGPTDIIYRLEGADVVAAIELKVLPTTLAQEARACAKDLHKLSKLQKLYPNIAAFFLLADQAMSVPGATGGPGGNHNWKQHVNGMDEHSSAPPTDAFIEFWHLRDLNGKVEPHITYWY